MVETRVEDLGRGAKFRLAADVQVVPEKELPHEVRDRLAPVGGRFALVRPGARTGPLLVDGEIAALLDEFLQPSTIAESLIRFSNERQRDPQDVLREQFPMLRLLVERRFLIDADGAHAKGSGGLALDSGDRIGDFMILRSLQRMEDTEVFQVMMADRRFGALKIERCASSMAAECLAHEAKVLRLLAGDPGPELVDTGEHDGKYYLVLEWRQGSEALVITEEWRRQGGATAWKRILEVCCRILETYGHLHRRGVVHGDVNARNILLDRQDRVTLLDFEAAVSGGPVFLGDPPGGRAGVPIYLEPEYAKAVLQGEPPPPASAGGEQYSLAVLAYEMIVGVPYIDYDLRRDLLLEQIVEQPPAPFADRGLSPRPAVEEVLARALSKEPSRRFSSVEEMAAALENAELSDSSPMLKSSSRRKTGLDELIRLTTEKSAPAGAWTTEAAKRPTEISVYRGVAGVALALYRISRQRGQAVLLEHAGAWIRRASRDADQTRDDENLVGASVFTGAAGIHLVEAMIASELDQPNREDRALVRALHAVSDEPSGWDLFDGLSSRLLTMSRIVDRLRPDLSVGRAELEVQGRQAVHSLWRELESWPRVADTVGDLGMAHGWAGHLYAMLQWSRSAGTSPPDGLHRRLGELAEQSLPVGRGLMWPWRLPLGGCGRPKFTAGWCNGSAGYVFLWTTAARVFGDQSFFDLAQGAAWNAWESAQREGSLCCGLAGRAYALLDLYRITGKDSWLVRAHDLAGIAANEGGFDSSHPGGLFQGELGLALLAADLGRPDQAWYPFLTAEPKTS